MGSDDPTQKPSEEKNRSGVSDAIRRLGQNLKPYQQGDVQSLPPDRLGDLAPKGTPESAKADESDTQNRLKALSKPSVAPRIASEPEEVIQRGPRACP